MVPGGHLHKLRIQKTSGWELLTLGDFLAFVAASTPHAQSTVLLESAYSMHVLFLVRSLFEFRGQALPEVDPFRGISPTTLTVGQQHVRSLALPLTSP